MTSIFLLKNYPKNIKTLEFYKSYGSLYFEIRTESRASIIYMFTFLVRRIVFAVTVVSLIKSPILQINLLFAQSILVLIYLVSVKPFETRLLNFTEILNELTFLATLYPLLIFCDYN